MSPDGSSRENAKSRPPLSRLMASPPTTSLPPTYPAMYGLADELNGAATQPRRPNAGSRSPGTAAARPAGRTARSVATTTRSGTTDRNRSADALPRTSLGPGMAPSSSTHRDRCQGKRSSQAAQRRPVVPQDEPRDREVDDTGVPDPAVGLRGTRHRIRHRAARRTDVRRSDAARSVPRQVREGRVRHIEEG